MTRPSPNRKAGGTATPVEEALDWLKAHSSKAHRDGLTRYAIPSERAFGVSMGNVQALAKRLGRNHELAAELWKTGWYEARMLAAYVDEPAQVSPKQMDQWCKDFDNWAICDTVCFALFDRTPAAWNKIEPWSRRKEEFVRRAAFALLWGLSVHAKGAGDAGFMNGLKVIERTAGDDRNFVKKAVSMALRGIGKRNQALNAAALAVAERLAASPDAIARWIGKGAIKELTSPILAQRLARRASSK